jgi:hypothetical protein
MTENTHRLTLPIQAMILLGGSGLSDRNAASMIADETRLASARLISIHVGGDGMSSLSWLLSSATDLILFAAATAMPGRGKSASSPQDSKRHSHGFNGTKTVVEGRPPLAPKRCVE